MHTTGHFIEKLMDKLQHLMDTWCTPELVCTVHEASSVARFSPCILVMCDNDFTTVLIIMVFVSRYDSYHDSDKMQNLVIFYLSYVNNAIPKCDLVIVQ